VFLYQSGNENDRELARRITALLGLQSEASKDEIVRRAKKLGELNEEFAKRLQDGSKIETKKETTKHGKFYIR